MTLHRFHVPGASAGRMELPEVARRHATRVLRLETGDALRVFDQGREFEARIAAIEKQRVLVEVGGEIAARPEPRVALHLVMSALKGDLTELVIQKTTELGVARISPAIFERTDTVARRDPGEARVERWHRVAVGAAEQSGRAIIPQIDAVSGLESTLESLGTATDQERRIVAAEPAITAEPTRVEPFPELRAVVVAVGPAGGLGPRDLEALEKRGFVRERFALHTLRAETACIATIAILGDRYK